MALGRYAEATQMIASALKYDKQNKILNELHKKYQTYQKQRDHALETLQNKKEVFQEQELIKAVICGVRGCGKSTFLMRLVELFIHSLSPKVCRGCKETIQNLTLRYAQTMLKIISKLKLSWKDPKNEVKSF